MRTAWLAIGTVMAMSPVFGPANAAATDQEQPVNLLPNPSFEEETGGQPTGWRTERWGGEAVFEHAQIGHTGARSVVIASEKGADVGWTCTIPVEPYARHRLSGWIKTENIQPSNGRGTLLNIHNIQPLATRALTGTNDWTLVEVEFETGEQDAVQVNCTLGAWGLATGKAWYDDLRVEQIGKAASPEPRITIDATTTGAPLSKYIYGQFIEHLGRCIYGGIWAEMLEDRKFFYAVGAPESLWKLIGPTDALTMVREGAFVGEHTPQITLTGDGTLRGIRHGGLGLVAGKAYVGHVWLARNGDAAPVQVSLVWGDAPSDRQTVAIEKLTDAFTKAPVQFTAGGSTDDGRLEIAAAGRGSFRIGAVSLMPADNVQGVRADTLAVLKELNSPVYRWPGGNFVSGYNWKDGLGDPDRRPPRRNPS